jgi:hypothetical protein
VELDRPGIDREPVLQYLERFVVTTLIVQLVSLLIELV